MFLLELISQEMLGIKKITATMNMVNDKNQHLYKLILYQYVANFAFMNTIIVNIGFLTQFLTYFYSNVLQIPFAHIYN